MTSLETGMAVWHVLTAVTIHSLWSVVFPMRDKLIRTAEALVLTGVVYLAMSAMASAAWSGISIELDEPERAWAGTSHCGPCNGVCADVRKMNRRLVDLGDSDLWTVGFTEQGDDSKPNKIVLTKATGDVSPVFNQVIDGKVTKTVTGYEGGLSSVLDLWPLGTTIVAPATLSNDEPASDVPKTLPLTDPFSNGDRKRTEVAGGFSFYIGTPPPVRTRTVYVVPAPEIRYVVPEVRYYAPPVQSYRSTYRRETIRYSGPAANPCPNCPGGNGGGYAPSRYYAPQSSGPLLYRGQSSWTWPGDLRQHMSHHSPGHGLNIAGMSDAELMRQHVLCHQSGRVTGSGQQRWPASRGSRYGAPIRTYASPCPGGVCPH